jgi:hypothetical protein
MNYKTFNDSGRNWQTVLTVNFHYCFFYDDYACCRRAVASMD